MRFIVLVIIVMLGYFLVTAYLDVWIGFASSAFDSPWFALRELALIVIGIIGGLVMAAMNH